MTLILIVFFILIALFLIWLEFFIVPGITIAGIGGVLLMLGTIFYTYYNVGVNQGHLILAGSVVLTFSLLCFSFRSKTWKKTALDTNIDSAVLGVNKEKIKVGDEAVCLSRLAPMGTILVNGETVEAKSKYGYIDEKERVIILAINNTNVLVEKK